MKDLNIHLGKRLDQLTKAKQTGVKIVGYFPGNYVPEEMIYASGAVPICLASASSQHANAALVQIPDVICPFARAQIGHKLLKNDEYYDLTDLVIAPLACVHMKEAAEIWEYYGGVEIFKLGVPHQYDSDWGLEYYYGRLQVLKERLEEFTGNLVTDSKLSEAIDLYNRIRASLRSIALMRRTNNPPITSREFIDLNHAGFFADPSLYADMLEEFCERLKNRQRHVDSDAPRLLLVGPNLSHGDYSITDLIESAGGSIVAEDIFEGLRHYSENINKDDDPVRSLAVGYLRHSPPPALMRNSAALRVASTMKTIKDHGIQGVVWYQLANCEVYDAESYFFIQRMQEFNIPVVVLESDYESAGLGQLRVRLEALLEQIKGV